MTYLLYTPIDISFEMPSIDKIEQWFEENKIDDLGEWSFRDGEHEWAIVATGQLDPVWKSVESYARWQKQDFRHNPEHKTQYAPGFAETFPTLCNAIEQLPFKEIGIAGMMKQLDVIDEHRDTFDPNHPLEPRRYMIYLTDVAHNTFWIRSDKGRELIQFPDGSRVVAFNNQDTKHGAIKPTGLKIWLSVIGILDDDAHRQLLEQSVKKYSSYVIKSDRAY